MKRPVTGNHPTAKAMLPRQRSNRVHPNTTKKNQNSKTQGSKPVNPNIRKKSFSSKTITHQHNNTYLPLVGSGLPIHNSNHALMNTNKDTQLTQVFSPTSVTQNAAQTRIGK